MKTPAWSPNRESLTWRDGLLEVARSGRGTTSGANASSEQTFASSGASARIVGGKNVPVGVAAEQDARAGRDGLVHPGLRARGRLRVDHRAEIRLRVERVAQPEARGAASTKRSTKSSQTSSWTKIRWTLMQTWPA